MEMADMILVNKADGDLKPAAIRTCADYAGALRLLRKRPQDPDGFPKALTVSAVEEAGLESAWADIQTLIGWRREQGHWDARRAEQAVYWFQAEVREGLLARLRREPVKGAMAALARQVEHGDIAVSAAAEQLLTRYLMLPGVDGASATA
ncbi:MAG: methylmalonyl Co-A mutase-associated GTPase MeaB, partial [Roseivivax sp.]|nr:methylmalonyl Co-A mutase-associated GTPase MeaB [Roseivivax sp.]